MDSQKVLEKKKMHIEANTDLIKWFSEFDNWANRYWIPQQARYVRLTMC